MELFAFITIFTQISEMLDFDWSISTF